MWLLSQLITSLGVRPLYAVLVGICFASHLVTRVDGVEDYAFYYNMQRMWYKLTENQRDMSCGSFEILS